MRLYGQCLQHFDAKGRVVVPRRFRDAIGQEPLRQGMVVTVGFEHCLFLFTRELWNGVLDELEVVHFTSESGRAYQRLFLNDAEDVAADKLGRILVPERLRQWAGLEDEVLFVGVMNRLELWSPSRWTALKEAHVGQYEELAEQFHGFLEARKHG